jgi:hypothetical protein
MKEYLIAIIPILIMLFYYFVKLESRLAGISQDLHWIKREIRICRQPSDNPSP